MPSRQIYDFFKKKAKTDSIAPFLGMPIESLSSGKKGDGEYARLLVDGDSKTNGDISSEDPAIEIEDLDSIHEILNIFKAFI